MYGITEPKPIKKRIFKSVIKAKPHVSVREKLEKKLANSAIKNLINDIFSEESSNASKIKSTTKIYGNGSRLTKGNSKAI